MKRRYLLLLLPLIIVLPIALPMLYNTVRLTIFALPLFWYPLPAQTEVLSYRSEVGVLDGAGNHCDFRATMRLHTALTEQAIRDYYKRVSFPTVGAESGMAAIAGLNNAVPIWVSFDAADAQLVEVSIYDGIYSRGFGMGDPRCH
jgi:hypothetical protein